MVSIASHLSLVNITRGRLTKISIDDLTPSLQTKSHVVRGGQHQQISRQGAHLVRKQPSQPLRVGGVQNELVIAVDDGFIQYLAIQRQGIQNL